MNHQQAKGILLLYRPGGPEAITPEVREALDLAAREPELGQWLDKHLAFQEQVRGKLRQLEAPLRLKQALVQERKIIRPQAWWQRPPVWLGLGAAAAAVVLALALLGLPGRPRDPEGFASFQERMVGVALREYRMDLVTNDMRELRGFIARSGAPADYDITPGLQKLELTGGGLLRWRNNPVAMVCFNRGNDQMLFLFVVRSSALKQPPPPEPQVTRLTEMMAVSWTRGRNTYVLAGSAEADFLKKYL